MYFLRFLVASGEIVNLVPILLSWVKVETHMSFKNLREEGDGRVRKSKSLCFQKKKKMRKKTVKNYLGQEEPEWLRV